MTTGMRVATASPRHHERPALSPRAQAWLLGIGGAALALVAWTLLAQALVGGGGVINRLPPPLRVAQELDKYARTDLVRDVLFSLRVFAIGWLVGASSATVVGLILGRAESLG